AVEGEQQHGKKLGAQAGAGRPTILAISARAERARASSPEVAKARSASEAVRARDNTAVARAGSTASSAVWWPEEPSNSAHRCSSRSKVHDPSPGMLNPSDAP